jgi:hypothetical protein
VRPSSIQSTDVYGAWNVGGFTTSVGGTGGGGQIAGEGFGPPAGNDPVPVAGPGAHLMDNGAAIAIAALIGLAVWSYLEG